MARQLAAAFLTALVALGAVTSDVAASGSASEALSGTATFSDPAGDAQGGPDVTRVVINGDGATGSLSFTATARGLGAAASQGIDREVVFWLDTDSNGSTGDPEDGTEYGLLAWNDSEGAWWNVLRWNGSSWESVPETASMRVTGGNDSVTFSMSSADLGGAAKFRFYVVAGNWNTGSERYDTRDDAPDNGWWSYDVAAPSTPTTPTTPSEPKVSLLVGAPKAAPKAPVAGRPFTVTFPVRVQTQRTATSIDLQTGETREAVVVTWQPAAGGTMTCSASVGRRVPVRCGAFKGDAARASLVVPKSAAGKLLKLTVRITARDKETGKTTTATKIATFRVK